MNFWEQAQAAGRRAAERGAEWGAEAGETGQPLDKAEARVEAEVQQMARELFVLDTDATFDAELTLLTERLAAERVALQAAIDRRAGAAAPAAWDTWRAVRVGAAVVTGAVSLSAGLYAGGVIGPAGSVLLVAGALSLTTAAPEIARAAERARDAAATRRAAAQARARASALQDQLRDLVHRRAERDDLARRREEWIADTKAFALAELQFHYGRGVHARAAVN